MNNPSLIRCDQAIPRIEGFRYEGDPLDFSAHAGEIINIIGPDYSGKSAWVKMMSGKEPPYSGNVSIFGKNVFDNARADWIYLRTNAAFIETDTALLSAASGLQNVLIPALYHAEEKATHAIDRANKLIKEIAPDTNPDVLPAMLRKDQRYKLAVARALILRPQAIILDNPFEPLDVASATAFKSFMLNYAKENDALLIVVSHDIQFALQHSDKILFVSKNHIESFDGKEDLLSSDITEINDFLKLNLSA